MAGKTQRFGLPKPTNPPAPAPTAAEVAAAKALQARATADGRAVTPEAALELARRGLDDAGRFGEKGG